jgi:hypothetical protein
MEMFSAAGRAFSPSVFRRTDRNEQLESMLATLTFIFPGIALKNI